MHCMHHALACMPVWHAEHTACNYGGITTTTVSR
jgi:hypothetical protein